MVKRSVGEKIFNSLNIFIMLLALAAVLLPLLSVVSTSLVSAQEIARKPFVLFPEKIDFTAYTTIFMGTRIILDGYKITVMRVIIGTGLNLTFTYFVAYALAKKDLPGRSALTMFFFFTMLFSGGLIPYYIIIKSTGLMDRFWVYIIPGIISVWNTLLVRNFIMQIPESINESAEIDGANDIQKIFRIVLPLSIPALATIGLFYAVAHWNSWWDAYLFVKTPQKQPIQLVLRNILAQAEVRLNSITGKIEASEIKAPARSIQNAAVVVTTIPVVLIYPFLQKYFIKGIMIGAVKG